MAATNFRRTKLIKFIQKEIERVETELKYVPDSRSAHARSGLLQDLMREFDIEYDELNVRSNNVGY